MERLRHATLKDITVICTVIKDGLEKQETATITTSDTRSEIVRATLRDKFKSKILACKVERISLTKENYENVR